MDVANSRLTCVERSPEKKTFTANELAIGLMTPCDADWIYNPRRLIQFQLAIQIRCDSSHELLIAAGAGTPFSARNGSWVSIREEFLKLQRFLINYRSSSIEVIPASCWWLVCFSADNLSPHNISDERLKPADESDPIVQLGCELKFYSHVFWFSFDCLWLGLAGQRKFILAKLQTKAPADEQHK